MTARTVTRILGVLLLPLLLLGQGAAHADARSVEVRGGWLGELPCAFTSLEPASPPNNTLSFRCVSGTTWTGDWTGHTYYVVTGTADLAANRSRGTIDETFVGIDTASRASGTLHLVGTLVGDGTTNTIVVDECIVGGTGAFERTSGRVQFEGFQASGLVGQGGYHGTLGRRCGKC